MSDELRPVPGFEGLYSVTEDGRIWSAAREWETGKGARLRHSGKWLKWILDKGTGYYIVGLHKKGKRRNAAVHQVVAWAWIPNPSNLPEVNHIDGVKANCHRGNLEWCTKPYNVSQSYKQGLHGPMPGRKLDDSQAATIRRRRSEGESVTVLAREFKIDRKTVYGVLNGRTYRVQ